MKTLRFTLAAITTLLLGSVIWSCNKDGSPAAAADVTQAQQAPPTMNGPDMMEQMKSTCPMGVTGADVIVADTEGGVTLTFATETGDVADLRQRVQHMGQMYDKQGGQGGMRWHHMGPQGNGMGMGQGMGMGEGGPGKGTDMPHMAGNMPAASTILGDTDTGAQLEFRPTDASQLIALREQVRSHHQRMHSGDCWMAKEQL